MAVILQKDANRGTNDTNEGIYVDIATLSLGPVTYDFDNTSSYIIDVRGRNSLGLFFTSVGADLKYKMTSTSKEYASLADLVVGDFTNTIETEVTDVSAGDTYDAIDITTDADNFMATAVLIQFAANVASGVITAWTLTDGTGTTDYDNAEEGEITGDTSGAANATSTLTVTAGVITAVEDPPIPAGSGYIAGEATTITGATSGAEGATGNITTVNLVSPIVTGIIRALNK